MDQYIGFKMIDATPESAPTPMGKYKVGDPGYKVRYEDGYTSWSPKKVFEEAYQSVNAMTFSRAMAVIERGGRVGSENLQRRHILFIEYQNMKVMAACVDNRRKLKPNGDIPVILLEFHPEQCDMISNKWFVIPVKRHHQDNKPEHQNPPHEPELGDCHD